MEILLTTLFGSPLNDITNTYHILLSIALRENCVLTGGFCTGRGCLKVLFKIHVLLCVYITKGEVEKVYLEFAVVKL